VTTPEVSTNSTNGSSPDSTPPKDPEAIRAEIERTRDDLAETVDALHAKLDVKAQARAKAAEVKDSMTTDSGKPRPELVAAAVAVVALLIGLLAWQVVRTDQGRSLRDRVAAGENPPAPVFRLDALDDSGPVALSDLRGKAVVVNFWASWCLPCKEESRTLEEAWQRWRDRDVVILGLDLQDFSGDAQRFVDRYGISYPVLRDKDNWTWGRYGLTGLPETWFVDRRGRLVGDAIQGPVSADDLDRNIELALGTPS